MANLLDTIRQNTAATATQKQGLSDESGKLATLLRAKSGREVGGGDIGASNLGEQQAVTNTNNQMAATVAPAAQLQNAQGELQQASQEQQVQGQKQDIAQSRRFDDLQTKLKTNSLLQELEQNKGRMDQQRQDALTAQAAQNLRLQNSQYLDSLQREGQRNRLDSENGFNEALADSTFGDNKQLLEASLGNKSVLDANDNEFRKAMGQMSTENAYDVFHNEMKSAKERGMYQAIGGVLSAGAGAAGTMSKGGSAPAASPAGSNASDYTSLPDGNGTSAEDYRRLK